MTVSAALQSQRSRLGQPDVTQADLDHLGQVIDHAAHLLPAQGPITVFIHHNTLHAFEDIPFHQAIEKAAQVFGCRRYLAESWYRDELWRGRIRFADLEAVLREDLGPQGRTAILNLGTRLELRQAMLQYPLRSGPTAELLWFVAETDALRHIRPDASLAVRGRLISDTHRWVMRDLRGGPDHRRPSANGQVGPNKVCHVSELASLLERFGEGYIEEWSEQTWEAFTLQALWRICCQGVATVPAPPPDSTLAVRHRDLLFRVTGEDTDQLVHEVLIPFCAAFLDQGLAHWTLPRREEGFYRAFAALYRVPAAPGSGWLRGLSAELERLEARQTKPLESIRESLELLGVPASQWEDFLAATLLALRGWAGMLHFVEHHPDRAVHSVAKGSLIEFLAVRLILDRLALAATSRDALGFTGSLATLHENLSSRLAGEAPPSVEQRAFLVFQLAQVMGWTPEDLFRLTAPQWTMLLSEIEAFTSIERRRIFHLAYERRFLNRSLDALALHEPAVRDHAIRPRFQVMCCLDEREESFRRHLEEIAPDVETFGIAGFYGVAMYYRGAADAHFVPLCPIVVQPRHWVTEQVVDNLAQTGERRARVRKLLGTASHHFHAGSRTFALGAILSATVGVLASIPLIAGILFPRLTARLRRWLGGVVEVPPATTLQIERAAPAPGPDNGCRGFSLDEMVAIALRQLGDVGLTRNFARLVLLLGHGSGSQNNPHKSAYDCGACGGSPGAPNARSLARMVNDPRVRDLLKQRGLTIPDDTVFIGGYHNTCNDSVTLLDLDLVPSSHQPDLEAARRDIEQACDRNAHERCRRFASAPLTLSFVAARRHVEARAEDMAQTRPELGHATNALCIVGRRERTRGLFLDRRAFLTSYDPTQDDAEASILTRILQAAVPVCAGINLEYYFSRIDPVGYGCSTKLPHNVASLLGVMEGAASDLRTGLPWQMVEIHEPVRLTFAIETTPAQMERIMDRNPGIARLVRNGWVHLVLLDPHSRAIRMYQNGAFVDYRPTAETLPQAPTSADWYRGWRDHLEFARIG